MEDQVVVREPGESKALWMLGGLYEIKASAEETGGSLSVVEFTIPEGSGPPPHVHDCGEAVYVLEGKAKFHVDGAIREAGPGSFLYFPKGTEETFEPVGTVRIVVFYTPGGIDKFFEEAGEQAQRREIPPPPEAPPDLERLSEIASRHGLELKMPQQV